MNYLVIIEADTNDGDYIEKSSYMDKAEIDQLKRILEVIKTTATKYSHNWSMGEYVLDPTAEEMYGNKLSQDDYEFMSSIIPYGENGIHSIESVRLLKVEEDIDIF